MRKVQQKTLPKLEEKLVKASWPMLLCPGGKTVM